MANWGCSAESVFDAVSLAEQYACTKNRDDSDAWNIYFRKDLFEPVVIPSGDKVATNLIYHQIIGGIRAGEYVCLQVSRNFPRCIAPCNIITYELFEIITTSLNILLTNLKPDSIQS